MIPAFAGSSPAGPATRPLNTGSLLEQSRLSCYHFRLGAANFVGDPPQEEQGLYSVFDSDASSLKLIADHDKRLKTIGAKQ